MIKSNTITAEREKELLQQWFDSVEFIGEETAPGTVPPLDDEVDDEERSLIYTVDNTVTTMDTDALLAELRKRDPSNPF